MNKPYSESCDQNKDAILSVISPVFSNLNNIFEIGSGTGQHAIYFAEKMPQLTWHTSDCLPYLEGIQLWLTEASLSNVRHPIELDVNSALWPEIDVEAVFTANSLHIMSQQDVLKFMSGVGYLLNDQGHMMIYGPFNYNGEFSSQSNARFDQWLKDRDPNSGIKHFEKIVQLANENSMQLVDDYEMPANNRILHFRKTEISD